MSAEENKTTLDENAFFSIRREDLKEDGEYFYIRANSAGLKKYAKELNKIADEIQSSTEKTNIKLPKEFWLKGDISLDFVEIIKNIPTTEELLLEPDQKHEPQSKWVNLGCGAVIIFLLVSIITGVVTIIKWLNH